MPWQNVHAGTLAALTDATVTTFLGQGTPIPRFFMTGDGHANPPFMWTMACPAIKLHFQTLMGNHQLFAHVEQQQEDVSDASVPVLLQPLYEQKRIYGWELDIYRELIIPMNLALELIGQVGDVPPSGLVPDVVALDRELIRLQAMLHAIGNPASLQQAAATSFVYRQYYQRAAKPDGVRNLVIERNYQTFLQDYSRATMALRTQANRYIGLKIQNVLNLYPTATHLITCGDAHILHDPLAVYITLPGAALGLVDPRQR